MLDLSWLPFAPGLVLGRSGPLPIFPKVRLPHKLRSGHMYVVGKTGKGKSKFLQSCVSQDIAEGRGCGVIDPQSDLIADLLELLYQRGSLENPELMERIVYVNPADHRHVIAFNVLAAQGDPYEIAQNVIEAFRRAYPETLREAPHFANLMLHALLVLIKTGMTLIELPRLLVDQAFRDSLLAQAGDRDLASYFHDRYDRWQRDAAVMRESSLNKVTALTVNPHLRLMLGQRQNRLNIRAIMDEGKVLLADLGHCDEESQKLIGNLLTTALEQAAFSRHDTEARQRRPFYLYIDEFHDFSATTGSVKTFSKILSGARKFGLHICLAHQNLSQLSERMKGAIGNVWTKVIFGVSEDDAAEFARWVGLGQIDPAEEKHEAQTETQHPVYFPLPEHYYGWATVLANQRPQQAILRDHQGRTRRIWTLPLPKSRATSAEIDAIKLASLKRWGIPYAAAKRNIEESLSVTHQTVSEAPEYDLVFAR